MKISQIPLTLLLTFTLVNNTIQLPSLAQKKQSPKLKPPATQSSDAKRTSKTGRGDCPSVSIPLTALIPDTGIGWTVAEHPTFWFYIPYPSKLNIPVEFVLKDGKDNKIYETKPFFIKQEPGIISITLPNNIAPLEINRRYKWSLFVICDQNHRHQDLLVYGRIQRVPLTPQLKTQLAKSDPVKKFFIYGDNSLWYEMLTQLGEMRLQKPKDKTINKYWADLLQSVGLNNISKEPITPCCTVKDVEK